MKKYGPSLARSGATPPPLIATTFSRSPIGAIALETPDIAVSTNGSLLTRTSLFIAVTAGCGAPWLSSY